MNLKIHKPTHIRNMDKVIKNISLQIIREEEKKEEEKKEERINTVFMENKIKRIEEGRRYTHDERFIISGNIPDLDDDIYNPEKIKYLLIKNVRTLIPSSVISIFINLESLHIDDCNVSSETISRLDRCEKLRDVGFSYLIIDNLSILAECKDLEIIAIRGCSGIDYIPNLNNCRNLWSITIDRCEIEDISFLSECENLKVLSLFHNNIMDISSLSECRKIEQLNLFKNRNLSNISVVSNFKNLRLLDLRKTSVSDISSVGECKNLRDIQLWNSNVIDISPLFLCSELEMIDPNYDDEKKDHLLRERFPNIDIKRTSSILKNIEVNIIPAIY
jgi:internalin A